MNYRLSNLLFLTFIFITINLQSQEQSSVNVIRKGDFPEGIYMTIEDVLNKKPSSNEELYYKLAEKREDTIGLPEKVFFYFKTKNKKLLHPLAVSYQGEMYFQTYNKYTNKKDKGFAPDAYSRFCKASSYGRFVYFEESMRGNFSKALWGTLNPATYAINGRIRGIVLDVENRELNMLRNCDDLNLFLQQHKIQDIKCESEKFTIGELRQIIDQINKPYQ